MLAASYNLPGPDVVFERFDGELVILDLSSGKYFGLNASAGVLWSALMTGVPAEQIVAAGAPADLVERFLVRLLEAGLVAAAPPAAGPALDAGLVEALAGLSGEPGLEVYEDLADLIMADPIHDVDADAGWPHLPGKAG